MKHKYIDLFAGIGGFRLAFDSVDNYECVFSSEINKACQDVYFSNYGTYPYGDITKIDVDTIPDFDILLGGFPCQPFSICGKKQGFEDTRGTLFFDICRIIEKKAPKVIVLENVKHLTKHNGGRTFQVILETIKDMGYNVSFKILNSLDFGLPQARERIFIIGTKNGVFNFDMLKKQTRITLDDILDTEGVFEYIEEDEYTMLDQALIKQQDKSGLIFCGYRNKSIWKKGVRENTLHLSRCHRQPNRIYSSNGTHPTIPSQEASGRFFIYIPTEKRVRKLTINECYKLMGFPQNFKKHSILGEQYKQIGNSVSVPIVKAIAEEIINQNLLSNSTQTNTYEIIRRNLQQLSFNY